MRSEAQLVAAVVTGLRDALPQARVKKHADTFTAGVPDISVTHRRGIWWIEAKFFHEPNPAPSLMRKKFDALQLAEMQLLRRESDALYLVGIRDKDRMTLAVGDPEEVAQALRLEWPLRSFKWLSVGERGKVVSWLAERMRA